VEGNLCAMCGFPVIGKPITSKFTSNIYCPEITECERRRKNDLTLEEIAYLLLTVEKECVG
jgi:predicted nucleic acid-binding Zn ribbon protein